ncbi:MAG: DJ-1/PfpI family protein [Vampirovibrionales bacterium]
MATVAFVIAPEQFHDTELNTPRTLLQEAGHTVSVFSTQTGVAVGMYGYEESVTQTLESLEVVAFDALVVVGGYGAVQHLWACEPLHTLVQQAVQAQRVTAAICVSPMVLANAGILAGKQATIWEPGMPENRSTLEALGAAFTGEAVTVDGLIITANSPDSATAFGHALVQALA